MPRKLQRSSPRRRSARLNPPPPATFHDLPLELLHHILLPDLCCSRAGRTSTCREYLNLRLVSKVFAAVVATYAFSDILIRDDESSLDRLVAIAIHPELAKYLKQYTYFFGHPAMQDRGAVNHYLTALAGARTQEVPEHMRKSLATLESKCKFDTFNEILHLHIQHLQTLPNLRSIAMTLCCSLSSRGDLNFLTNHRTALAVRAFLAAISERAKNSSLRPVENLTMDGLVDASFLALTPRSVSHADLGLRFLKMIKLSVGLRPRYRGDTPEPVPGFIKLIGRFLRSASQLESLALENIRGYSRELHPGLIDWASIVRPNNNRVHTWPNLKTLRLAHVEFQRDLLIQFLRTQTAQGLKAVHFTRCNIENGELLPVPGQQENEALVDEAKNFFAWPSALRELKPILTYSLATLALRELSDGKFGERHMHDSEADAWAAWILRKKEQRYRRVTRTRQPKGRGKGRGRGKAKEDLGEVIIEEVEVDEPVPGSFGAGTWCVAEFCLYPRSYASWDDSDAELDMDMDIEGWDNYDEDDIEDDDDDMDVFPIGVFGPPMYWDPADDTSSEDYF